MRCKNFLFSFIFYTSFLLISASSLSSQVNVAHNITTYLDFFKQHPELLGPIGNAKNGEIQVLLDPEKIEEAQSVHYERLLQQGFNPEFAFNASRAGIVLEDPFWLIIRDPVLFPSGALGMYNRLFHRSSLDNGPAGVVVAPILPDGRLVVILSYRHATRSWEVELCRGGRLPQEDIMTAAARETREETGYDLENPQVLGEILPDSGVCTDCIPIIMGQVKNKKIIQQDYSEAIQGVFALSKEQLKEALNKGYLEVGFTKDGAPRRYNIQDPGLSSFLFFAEYQGVW